MWTFVHREPLLSIIIDRVLYNSLFVNTGQIVPMGSAAGTHTYLHRRVVAVLFIYMMSNILPRRLRLFSCNETLFSFPSLCNFIKTNKDVIFISVTLKGVIYVFHYITY